MFTLSGHVPITCSHSHITCPVHVQELSTRMIIKVVVSSALVLMNPNIFTDATFGGNDSSV